MSGDLFPAVDEHGSTQYFQRDAYEALVAVGLIRVNPNGRATYRGSDVDFQKLPELAVCDFCQARPVTWDIEAETFEGRLSNFRSVGGWAACEACGQAVYDRDRDALRERQRAALRAAMPPGLIRLTRRVQLDEMLDLFWRHFISIARFKTPYAAAPGEQS